MSAPGGGAIPDSRECLKRAHRSATWRTGRAASAGVGIAMLAAKYSMNHVAASGFGA